MASTGQEDYAKIAARRSRGLTRTLSILAGDHVCRSMHHAIASECIAIVEDRQGGSSFVPATASSCNGQWPVIVGTHSARILNLNTLLQHMPLERRTAFLESLCDPIPQMTLERAGVINWHPRCSKLVALRTQSDGNCLCHAASLAVWGLHDRHLLLRKAVRSFFVTEESGPLSGCGSLPPRSPVLLRTCWESELCRNVSLSEAHLDFEWEELQRTSTLRPKYNTTLGREAYQFLEATHIFALAHVLRRPIIVLATDWTDTIGRQIADKDEIAGIYLPMQLPRSLCSRVPIVLAFDSCHFSPLLPIDGGDEEEEVAGDAKDGAAAKPDAGEAGEVKIPLMDRSCKLLPVPFFRRGNKSAVLRQAVVKHWMHCEHLESDGTLVVKYRQEMGEEVMVGAQGGQVFEAFMASVLETETVESTWYGWGEEDDDHEFSEDMLLEAEAERALHGWGEDGEEEGGEENGHLSFGSVTGLSVVHEGDEEEEQEEGKHMYGGGAGKIKSHPANNNNNNNNNNNKKSKAGGERAEEEEEDVSVDATMVQGGEVANSMGINPPPCFPMPQKKMPKPNTETPKGQWWDVFKPSCVYLDV